MIKQIKFFLNGVLNSEDNITNTQNEISLSELFSGIHVTGCVVFEIEFLSKIKRVRSASYTWTDEYDFYVAGPLVPKIIQLDNGTYIQANCTIGFWEISALKPNVLVWKINPEYSTVLAQYQGDKNFKIFENCFEELKTKVIKLLFTQKAPLEWSRSVIPFSAIACFTDHCDFDTLQNLQLQRAFFKRVGVTITKGIFVNHFSKREDNASWERDSEELKYWVNDGHELAYHSLSQSLKKDIQSFEDFDSFTPPLANMSTWIDHGFQPYNLSLLQKNNLGKQMFFSKMKEKGISVFWNYVDSGTGTRGVLNQLNLEHFTLKNFFSGIRKESFKQKMALGIKNIFFHFYADDTLIYNYKSLATKVKTVLDGKKVSQIPNLISAILKVAKPLLWVAFKWHSAKLKIYPLAKYNPVFFKIVNDDSAVSVFQTLEMVDLAGTLSKENVDSFCKERGMFIAHTYFSVPMDYHKGKLFLNPTTIHPIVEDNFRYLGERIAKEEIWNPTIAALNAYLSNVDRIEFGVAVDGSIRPIQLFSYHFRAVE